jgi:delta 1-pyrroline-5-carboxylate dehydrogenase
VQPDMDLYRDEIFGPVLSVVRVDSYDDALTLVKTNPYGNGTAIFTNDGGAARRFQNEVEVGMIGINVPIPVPVAYFSFGGWKASLFGDAHAYGMDGVQFFTRAKVVTSPKSTTQSVGADCAAVPLALKQQKLQLKWQAHDAKNKRTTVATTNAFVTFLDVAVASHVTVDGALITDPRKAFVGSFPLLLLSVTDEPATVNTACTGAGLHTLHLAGTAESLIPD